MADYAVDTMLGTGVGMLFGGTHGAWKHFRGETKDAVLRALQKGALDIGDGGPVDVGPILKDVVEAGQFNRGAALERLTGAGLGADRAETFLAHLDGLAAAQGMDADGWLRRHIADIEVGGTDGEGIRFAKKVLYDDTGKIRVEYEDTGTDFSLKDREVMKAYFDTLKPEKIIRLKYDDPNQYIEVVKGIADQLFPEGILLSPTKDWSGVDYEHFTKQSKRQKYVGTLPETIHNKDLKVVISQTDGEKFYFFKRYVDEELGKDIWDTVIAYKKTFLEPLELQTKIQTRRGRVRANGRDGLIWKRRGLNLKRPSLPIRAGIRGALPPTKITNSI
ncbi:hypothetical protein ACR42D_18205 [Desulfovibrio caledoniensis]